MSETALPPTDHLWRSTVQPLVRHLAAEITKEGRTDATPFGALGRGRRDPNRDFIWQNGTSANQKNVGREWDLSISAKAYG